LSDPNVHFLILHQLSLHCDGRRKRGARRRFGLALDYEIWRFSITFFAKSKSLS